MRRPLVSVIIPNYNGERFLRESINSVLRQTYTPIEVIVVDDGSTDNSKEIITSYKKRIKSYFLPHRNANVARNFGFRKSSGEYVQFLDSDVVIFPEKIKVQVERFRSLPADYGVIYGGYSVVERESNRRVDVLKGYRGNIYKILLEKDVVGNPSHLISRTTFERVGGYDEEMESMQDWDLWLRISNVSKFEFIPFLSAVYFIEGSQTSSNLLKVINGRKKLLHKYYKELAKFPYILSFHLYRLAYW